MPHNSIMLGPKQTFLKSFFALSLCIFNGATVASDTVSTGDTLCDYSSSGYNNSASAKREFSAKWSCTDSTRVLSANGIPDHEVGTFPNNHNPHAIEVQDVSVSYPIDPTFADNNTQLGGPLGVPGYMLNGIRMDPGSGGSCQDNATSKKRGACDLADPSGGWTIEAYGQSSFDFGVDSNNAHVQPGGAYHYHAMPEGLLTLLGADSTKMTLVGWAADGYPIYARYGHSVAIDVSSDLKVITGSYQLKTDIAGARPSPDLIELGAFTQDWEYVEGAGDLDECNGRFGMTPEFPEGIYHYFVTDSYPFAMRCVKGVNTAAREARSGGGGRPSKDGRPKRKP